MSEVKEVVTELMQYATPEELETFMKVYFSDESTVMECFGKSRESILDAFMIAWVQRRIEREVK